MTNIRIVLDHQNPLVVGRVTGLNIISRWGGLNGLRHVLLQTGCWILIDLKAQSSIDSIATEDVSITNLAQKQNREYRRSSTRFHNAITEIDSGFEVAPGFGALDLGHFQKAFSFAGI
jgi:hypothetical protein